MMIIQKNVAGVSWRLCSLILALGLLLHGCSAGRPVRPHTRFQQCDPKADAAITAGDWQSGLDLHENLLARDPANGLILFHLGYIWGKLENRAKEIAFYQKAIASGYSRDDRLYFNLGMAFAAVNQISDAVNALEEAVAIGSDNADNYFGLGLVYRQAGRLVEALAVLNRAIELDPQHWEAREELVRTDLDLSRWEDARRHLAWLEKTDPDHPTIQQLRETLEQRRLGDHTLRDKHT